MRKCEDCKIILDDTAQYCPRCGNRLPVSDGDVSTNVQVGALLTSANLHRIRHEWDKAIADATEALKIEPKNADIASLLGSIYEQRDMLEEAVNWYQMALEMNPSSAADQARLRMLNDRVEADRRSGRIEKRNRAWVMGGVAVLAVAVILVLVFAFGGEKRPRAGEPSTPANTVSRTANPPIEVGGSAPANAPRKSPASPDVKKEGDAHAMARTPAEVAIARKLEDSEALRESKVSIDDVIADPRQKVVTTTFSLAPQVSLTKQSVLQTSAAVAESVFAAHDDVGFVTVRCVIKASQAGPAQIAFVGDIARVTSGQLPADASLEQLQQAFTDQWWHPQMK